jgi:hypothetical protein
LWSTRPLAQAGRVTTARAPDPFGRFVGTVVAAVFGLVFVFANTGELPAGAALALRIVAGLVGVALLVGAVLTFRRAARAGAPVDRGGPARGGPGGGFGRGYWVIVAAEVLALVLGLVVINGVLDAPRFAVAWVALVVGAHFAALALLWGLRLFHVLAAVLVLLGLAGFVAGAAGASAAVIGLIAGVGSGAALFVAAGSAIELR